MKRSLALLLALCCAAACFCGISRAEGDAFRICCAEYPEMAAYPDEAAFRDPLTGEMDYDAFDRAYQAWSEGRWIRYQHPAGYADDLQPFFARCIRQFLSETNGSNAVCSPLNLYLALAMLSEVTGGESREQILSLLNAADMDALRTRVRILWDAHYCDDGALTCIPASSLWLRSGYPYNRDSLERLAEVYRASTFSGEMGSPEYDKALQSWINEQTGGLLKEQAASLRMEPETILSLVSTLYYRGRWASEFYAGATEKEIFRTAAGSELQIDFMKTSRADHYYLADHFSAVSLGIEGDGSMWLLLPEEGVTPEALLSQSQTMEFLQAGANWENSKYLIVNLAVPKFDVSSGLDLTAGLQALGITDVFDSQLSDFRPITEDSPIQLSQAQHAARVTIDEEGLTAAAFTAMMVCGTSMPPEETVDFILDRPFLFAVMSHDRLPLFVGVVNSPVS